jgi:ABC-type multidrug transport system permease subunit
MKTQRVTALVIKDLKKLVREPANLFMALLFPMILTLAFGAAFGGLGSGTSDTTYTIGLVSLDLSGNTKWADSFTKGISDTAVLVTVEYVDNLTAYNDLIQGKIDAIVFLPTDFGDSVDSFIAHPTDPVHWVNTTLGLALDQGSMIVSAVVPPMIQQVLAETILGKKALSMALPLKIGVPTQVQSLHLTQFDYMVPGLFAYSAIFVTMLVAQAFSTEREQGLLQRISMTSTSSSEIIISQIIANLIIGAIQVAIVYLGATFMGFRAQASIIGIAYAYVIILFLVICNVGFGLITASLVKSSGAATGLSFIFILPQMLLGTFIPAAKGIARFVPSHYVTDALTSLFLRGAPPTSQIIMLDMLVVVVLGLGIVLIGIGVFQKFGMR